MLRRALLALIVCAGLAAAPQAHQAPAFELKPCPPGRDAGAECGRLFVPENRSTRQGRQLPINFTVVRADVAGAKTAVFLLAGGPGSASTALIGFANGWLRPVRATMDVVMMDQRGTGGSGALACHMGTDANPASAFGHIMNPAAIKACRTALESRADLRQYTTDAAVADLEDVRARLGYDRIALLGLSYGTRLAQAYLRRHPEHVAAVVIDGVAPLDVSAPLSYARSLQRTIDLMIAACQMRDACRQASPRVAEDLASIVAKLEEAPARATVRPAAGEPVTVTMTRGDFAYAIRGMLYSPAAVTELPAMIARAVASGDLSEFAQRAWTRAG